MWRPDLSTCIVGTVICTVKLACGGIQGGGGDGSVNECGSTDYGEEVPAFCFDMPI